jgi:uncharacterized Tic20 family protein
MYGKNTSYTSGSMAKNTSYRIAYAAFLFSFIGLLIGLGTGPGYLGIHAPVFIHFLRSDELLRLGGGLRHAVNIGLSMVIVMISEVIFALPVIGIIYGIKLLVR